MWNALAAVGAVAGVTGAAATVGVGIAQVAPTHRQCTIEIKNHSTHYSLCDSRFYMNSGFCADMFPFTVDPSSSGSALFKKTPHAARGAVGVFTYDLCNKSTKETTEKIAVMFSVPYNFMLSSNWYAVGVFEKSKKCNYDLYYHMYNRTDNKFVRSKANGSYLIYKGDRVTIVASMTNTYQPVIEVEVRDV